MGSTSYDEVHEPFDPTWSGAAWYGPSTGEYWRVNPREYADPRKHGPEYQARAASRADRERARRDEVDAARRRRAGPGSSARGGRGESPGPRPPAADPPPASPESAAAAGAGPAPEPDRGPAGDPAGARGGDPWGPWVAGPRSWRPAWRRLGPAAIAWPPLGIVVAQLIGDATGCATFQASCTAPAELYPWVAQVAIVAALLALPGAARVLAAGTLTSLVVALPAAAVLAASGATYSPTRGPLALFLALVIAWLIGVAIELRRRRDPGRPA